MMYNSKRKPYIIIPFIVLAISVMSAVTMLMWNWLVPDLFGGPSVTWLQALGLLALSRILLASGWRRGHCRHHNGGWRHDLHEKFHEGSEGEGDSAPAEADEGAST